MSFPERFLKQTNHKSISLSEISSVVELPDGLTFRGLDLQTGIVSPVEILQTMIYSRAMAFNARDHGTKFLRMSRLAKDHLLFMVSGEAKVAKDIYSVQVAKYPAHAETRLNSYRKSSLILETSLTLSDNHAPVASVSTKLVYVAEDSRKSVSLPDWWTTRYQKLFEKTTVPHFKPFVSPKEMFCRGIKSHPYTFPVRRREQDNYGHVNTCFYLQFCQDALEHHLCSNNINCDIHTVSLLLKAAQWLHRGESQMGDILTVAFWDEETDPETVCFDITKSEQSIYQARMQFYGGSEINTGIKSHL